MKAPAGHVHIYSGVYTRESIAEVLRDIDEDTSMSPMQKSLIKEATLKQRSGTGPTGPAEEPIWHYQAVWELFTQVVPSRC